MAFDEAELFVLVQQLKALPEAERNQVLDSLPEPVLKALRYYWPLFARENQLPPRGNWWGWLVMAGRGFGKNRMGSEWVNNSVRRGEAARVGLIGRTTSDVRDVMVEGESGILSVAHPAWRPTWEPTKRRLTWPNGAIGSTYSAEEPDLLRGPQHDVLWGDEISTWRFTDAWDNAMMGLRLGVARWLATMTPKPTLLVRALLKEAEEQPERVRLVTGTTYENFANLSQNYIENVIRKYEGTRLGLQELYARLLTDNPKALFKRAIIDKYRSRDFPALEVIAVALDPSASSTGAEAGIVCGGIAKGHAFVLDDDSLRGKPEEWATAAVRMFYRWKANHMVAEINHGGDMVIATILNADRNIVVKKVTASRGKAVRAEPISLLYEQGKVHHVGTFAELEDQMCTWEPGDRESPDRMDALVWMLTDLMVNTKEKRYGVKGPQGYGILCSRCLNVMSECTCPDRKKR